MRVRVQEMSMKPVSRIALALAALACAGQAAAQLDFYEHEGFEGRSFTTQQAIGDFNRLAFNDRASSVVVLRDRWEVCEDEGFGGRCVVLRARRHASLAAMRLNGCVSSARMVGDSARIDGARDAPAPAATCDDHRRGNERLYQARVISVRAMVGTPEQRCWVEREQVASEGSGSNVPVAIADAVIGGVLGHQVGGGQGKDLATADGAVAGALVGANIGRSNGAQQLQTRDVQRCDHAAGPMRAEYGDVTDHFRGQAHRVQTTAAPGSTVTVNRQGEPRA
jgi:uncharacterized protein YcfJ